jgi:hypothetical protein
MRLFPQIMEVFGQEDKPPFANIELSIAMSTYILLLISIGDN